MYKCPQDTNEYYTLE